MKACPTEGCRYLQGHMGRCNIGPVQAFSTLPDHYQPPGHGIRGLPPRPLVRASDTEAARKAKDAQARELAAKGELILWDVKPGNQLGIWGLLRSVSYSPVGAMLGLGLLVLCWLAGCV